jgi:hypothetical protein
VKKGKGRRRLLGYYSNMGKISRHNWTRLMVTDDET